MVCRVEFKWSPNDRVITPLGEDGIVAMVAVDDSSVKTYFIRTVNGSSWWTEALLREYNLMDKETT